MTQETIIKRLQEALIKGTGDLDDLEMLLNKVKEDVAAAKAEKEAAAAKAAQEHGELVAAIANRLLNNQLTTDDMAYIFNSFYRSRGLNDDWNAKDIETLFDRATKIEQNVIPKVQQFIGNLAGALSDLETDETPVKPAPKATAKKAPSSDTADDIIKRFLKNFGLD